MCFAFTNTLSHYFETNTAAMRHSYLTKSGLVVHVAIEHLSHLGLQHSVHNLVFSVLYYLYEFITIFSPAMDLLRPIMCRTCKKYDLFTVSILKYWAQDYEDTLAEYIFKLVTKNTGTPNRKRQRLVI